MSGSQKENDFPAAIADLRKVVKKTTCFGMPTLIETNMLAECIELCHTLGLQFIELNMNLPQYQTGQIDASSFKRAAIHNDIDYTIHLDENLNVRDFNPHVSNAYH